MAEANNPIYVTVWIWLVVLLLAGVTAFALPIPRAPAIALIFAIAAVKAGLVLREYMHLKSEHMLIYAIALVPLVLVIAMVLVLFPDIVFHR